MLEVQQFLDQVILFVPNLVAAAVILVVALYLARLARHLTIQAVRRRVDDQELEYLLGRLAHLSVIVLGAIVALAQVNVDVTGLLTGLGIIGFTLGFALKDIAQNFIAGVLLLLQQPFDLNDRIVVKGYEGTVTDIALRATTILTDDGQEIIIPNAIVYANPIVNLTKNPQRWVSVTLRLGYEADVEQGLRRLLQAVLEVEGVEREPQPQILYGERGDGWMEVKIGFWSDPRRFDMAALTAQVEGVMQRVAAEEGLATTAAEPGSF
ncbi:MAG: mechanosensitive ion channel family protein [Anaerolineae bacterium]